MRALRPKGSVSEKRKTVRRSGPGAAHLDKMLDDALRETFPTRDPVAITIETPLKAVALESAGQTLTAHVSPDPTIIMPAPAVLPRKLSGSALSLDD
jgi:hypothetical protein